MIHVAAEQLVAQFADRHPTLTGAYELALVEHVLVQLADPGSDYGELLDDLCQRRWTVAELTAPGQRPELDHLPTETQYAARVALQKAATWVRLLLGEKRQATS